MNTFETRLEFQRQLRAGVDAIFGGGMVYDAEKDRHILNDQDKRRMQAYGLDSADAEHVREFARNERYRMEERYSFGWSNWATTQAEKAATETGIDPPTFTIRWWHRLIYWLYKMARKYA